MSRGASSVWKRSSGGILSRIAARLSDLKVRSRVRLERVVDAEESAADDRAADRGAFSTSEKDKIGKNLQSNRVESSGERRGKSRFVRSAARFFHRENRLSEKSTDGEDGGRGSRPLWRGARGQSGAKPSSSSRERKRIAAEKVPFSVTEFEVYGLNHARLLSLLSEAAHIRRVRSEGRVLGFSAASRDKAKIVAILDTLCYDYKIKRERGIVLSLIGACRRAGVVCGLIATVVAVAMFPNAVTSVECVGEWNSDIARILSDNGIVEGSVLFSFDGAAVAEQLRALDGVVYASVEKVGTRVCVEVRAEHRSDSFIGVAGASVTATKRAMVTRVVVFSGTATVGYGDIVSAGDELIGGYLTVGEEKVPSAAAGEVYGMTYTEYSRFFPDTEITAVKGASKTYTRLTFGPQTPVAPESPFEDYILETTVTRNNLLVGYYVHTFRFTEVTYAESENTRTEEEMKSLAFSDAVTLLPVGATVMSATTAATRVDGGTLVKVTIAAEERIDSAPK